MSFQVGSACYSTQQAAAQVSASIQVGSIANHSNTSYFIDVESTTSNSISYSLTPLTGGLPIIVVTPYSAQPCNLLSLEDGLSMGWQIATVWISVYCLIFIAKIFKIDAGESNYGYA